MSHDTRPPVMSCRVMSCCVMYLFSWQGVSCHLRSRHVMFPHVTSCSSCIISCHVNLDIPLYHVTCSAMSCPVLSCPGPSTPSLATAGSDSSSAVAQLLRHAVYADLGARLPLCECPPALRAAELSRGSLVHLPWAVSRLTLPTAWPPCRHATSPSELLGPGAHPPGAGQPDLPSAGAPARLATPLPSPLTNARRRRRHSFRREPRTASPAGRASSGPRAAGPACLATSNAHPRPPVSVCSPAHVGRPNLPIRPHLHPWPGARRASRLLDTGDDPARAERTWKLWFLLSHLLGTHVTLAELQDGPAPTHPSFFSARACCSIPCAGPAGGCCPQAAQAHGAPTSTTRNARTSSSRSRVGFPASLLGLVFGGCFPITPLNHPGGPGKYVFPAHLSVGVLPFSSASARFLPPPPFPPAPPPPPPSSSPPSHQCRRTLTLTLTLRTSHIYLLHPHSHLTLTRTPLTLVLSLTHTPHAHTSHPHTSYTHTSHTHTSHAHISHTHTSSYLASFICRLTLTHLTPLAQTSLTRIPLTVTRVLWLVTLLVALLVRVVAGRRVCARGSPLVPGGSQ